MIRSPRMFAATVAFAVLTGGVLGGAVQPNLSTNAAGASSPIWTSSRSDTTRPVPSTLAAKPPPALVPSPLTPAIPNNAAVPQAAAPTTLEPQAAAPITDAAPANPPDAVATTTTIAPAAQVDAVREAELIAHANALRGSLGLAPLQVDPTLTAYGRNWATHLGNAGQLSHSDIGQLLNPWRIVGENVGEGPSILAIHDALVASPSHYDNLVEERYTHIGVGVVIAPDGRIWLAQIFGN